MYVGVVDYSAIVEISTIVLTNIDVLSVSLHYPRGDVSESSLIVAVNW
jgi:hypothetical protein